MAYTNSNDITREIREALAAGNRALDSLYEARRYLQSARNWGLVDLLGGGWISGMLKHSKMDRAKQCMLQAKYDLASFSKEVRDVDQVLDVDLNSFDFLKFADYFFDGVIADWLMQDKIHKTRSQLEDAITKVERLMDELESYRR